MYSPQGTPQPSTSGQPGGGEAPRYKSEVFMPIRQDSHSFEERQRSIWEDMHARMERRRKEWDDEVTSLRKDFFRLKPEETRRGSSDNLLEKMDLRNMFYDGSGSDSGAGNKVFRVSFDVSQFQPEEISVRTQDQRLIVNAKHEQKGSDKNVTREFSRQVDIPANIDPLKLHSTLSKDGILQVEAEVSAPAYDSIRDTAHRLRDSTAFPSRGSPNSHSHRGSTSSTIFDCAGPAVTEQDGTKIFRIAVDIGAEFQPADLTVKTVDRKLLVHARHEEKAPGRTSCKEFNREFDLPDSVDPNLVTASMTGDGRLVLEAPISSYTQGSYQGRVGSVKQPTVSISFIQARP